MNQKELTLKLESFIEKGLKKKFANIKDATISDIQLS